MAHFAPKNIFKYKIQNLPESIADSEKRDHRQYGRDAGQN